MPETKTPPSETDRNGEVPLTLSPDLLDWKWIDDERSKGAFKPFQGLNIAVLNKTVVGAAPPGPETMTLSERVVDRYGVDHRRVVVVYIDRLFEF